MYQVKEVAAMIGVSIRTLHHYDQIGLLIPATTTEAGYRLYSDENLERLQQVLFFKEMGISLQEIQQILDHPGFDRERALCLHREALLQKKNRLETMITTIDKTLDHMKGEKRMEKEELFSGLSKKEIEAHQQKYRAEVKEKYAPELVAESERRSASYSSAQWEKIQQEADAIFWRIAKRMDGVATDEHVQEAVAQWHQHINSHFYECKLDTFRGLADLYVADERFRQNIDHIHVGLAQFMHDAMHVYCDQHDR
ncbi:MerR family transcriptional regulator [Mechercharimyces sp. CAU 1602]|uniref:MerR family transcriptional regulator n=1 Tax=Mechercharimyces sp. CAU 1602 TaxID=2973933 RepID=UPI0021617647|nr:MerR family transcriptional regulator [Mechercharimyces sp. CAU 1602]MCS1351860.1 MerR family transcriptional regulator [Mechercharimyces sp. CAU 1602]